MTTTTDVLDLMQAKLETILRQHNASAGPSKMRLVWGEAPWEVELRQKHHDGTETEIREALLTFDGEDLEVRLSIGRPDRPGWLTICKYLREFRPRACAAGRGCRRASGCMLPDGEGDLVAGGGDTEGRIVAVGVSTCVWSNGSPPELSSHSWRT
jgi:hypothetical protein